MPDRDPPFDYAHMSTLMAQRGVDVVLVCSRANVGYLADYTYYTAQGLPFLMEDGREWSLTFVAIPRDPSMGPFITPVTGEEGVIAHADPWIADRIPWGPPWSYAGRESVSPDAPDDVADCVAAALRDRGLDHGRIALELAAVPAARYLRLRQILPRAEFVDAVPILWALRRVKTEMEILRLRRVAAATDAAAAAGFGALHAGCSEIELERVMAGTLVAQGVTYGWSSVAYGPKGATLVQPTDHLPDPGDIVRIDLVGLFAGYYSDISRVNAFSCQPSADARRAHAAVLAANEALRRETGPGVRCADLCRLTRDLLAAQGYPLLAPYAGHGIGRDVHEPPFLADWDETVLEPGMVIVLEPTIRVVDVGSVNIEDMVLVTANGCEPLTSYPRELRTFNRATL